MNTYRIKGNDINTTVIGDYLKKDKEGQIEIWYNSFIVAVVPKDACVLKIN